MSEQQSIKGACQHCNGRIAFPPAALGKTIQCPHCAKPTKLEDPAAGEAPLTAQPAEAVGSTMVGQATPAGDGQLKMACPHCVGRLQYPPDYAGAQIACPHCSKQVTLLGLPGAPVRPAQPAYQEPVEPAEPQAPQPALPKARIPSKKRPGGAGKKVLKNVAIGAAALLAVVGIAAGVAIIVKKSAGEDHGSGPTGEGLVLLESNLQKAVDGGLTYVVGSVTNFDNAQWFDVTVKFELFDANGQRIGETSDYNGNIAPRSGWDFQALVLEENADNHKLLSLEGDKDSGTP